MSDATPASSILELKPPPEDIDRENGSTSGDYSSGILIKNMAASKTNNNWASTKNLYGIAASTRAANNQNNVGGIFHEEQSVSQA